jgi:transcriptional regulator with XRE-family HTH domain
MNSSQIGKRIKLLRQSMRINQTELGKILSVSPSAISDIERGVTRLNVDDLVKLAKYFNVTVSTLLEAPKPLTEDVSEPGGVYTSQQLRIKRGIDKNKLGEALDTLKDFLEQSKLGEVREWKDESGKS